MGGEKDELRGEREHAFHHHHISWPKYCCLHGCRACIENILNCRCRISLKILSNYERRISLMYYLNHVKFIGSCFLCRFFLDSKWILHRFSCRLENMETLYPSTPHDSLLMPPSYPCSSFCLSSWSFLLSR